MEEIDLSEKLRQLEAEVEEEYRAKKEQAQKTWDEMTNPAVLPEYPDSPITMDTFDETAVTKEAISSDDKWALALAGGGGKCSYEIGVWKALREMNLMKNVIAVSGSSGGALNAALISLEDYDNAEAIWKNIMPKQFLDVNKSTIVGPLDKLVQRSLVNGLCSRDGLVNIIDNYLDISKLPSARIPAYACVAWYTSDCIECLTEKPVAEYISLSEVDRHDAKQLLLASSALPYIYPPELIHDKVYRDGGLADNVPIKPLTTVGANRLIVVKLEPDDKVDTGLYGSFKEVVEIVPSREIGDLWDGALDFAGKNVLFRLMLGYYDTLRAFSLRMYKLNNLPLDKGEILRRENEDFERVMAAVRRDRALSSAKNNMSKINEMFDKFHVEQ